MKNSISKIFLIILITIFYTSCAKKIVSESNQSERFIEGIITASEDIDAINAEVYLYGTDLMALTDDRGYFKLILPKEYEVSNAYYVEVLTTNNGNNQFGFNLYENRMNELKLENFELNLIDSIIRQKEIIVYGTTVSEEVLLNAYKIKFKIVYDYSFDFSFHLDESWSEDSGKPVPNATIEIQGTENIYKTNENGEIWIEDNKIKIGDVIIIEDEMGSKSQVRITDKILEDKVIPYNLLIHID